MNIVVKPPFPLNTMRREIFQFRANADAICDENWAIQEYN